MKKSIIYLLLLTLVTVSCKSGFYGVFVAPKVAMPPNHVKPVLNDVYMTTHLAFENSSIFTTKENFTTVKNKKLSHLYLYVDSYNLLLKKSSQIPIMLYRTEDNPLVDLAISSELLIKYPLNNQYRSQFNFSVQSVALEKEKSEETATFIFGLAKPLVTTATASNPAASAALNIASEIFEKSYASEDYKYTMKVSLQEINDGQLFHAFFIIPINKSDSVFQSYENELKKPFFIRKIDNKYKLTLDSVTPYTNLPYILVYQTFDDHFQDSELLSGQFDEDLVVLTNDRVVKAKDKLSTLESSLLTEKQYSYEISLLSYVENYLRLKDKIEFYASGNKDEESVRDLVDSYLNFKSLVYYNNQDTFYTKYYKNRFEKITSKGDQLFSTKIPFANLIRRYVSQFQFDNYGNLQTIEKAEVKLKEMKSVVTMINTLYANDTANPTYKGIKVSQLYKKALIDVSVIESHMLSTFYLTDIVGLSSLGCSNQGNTLRDRLVANLTTSCEICKKDINAALINYNATCTTPTERIIAISSASDAKSYIDEARNVITEFGLKVKKSDIDEINQKSNLLEKSIQTYMGSKQNKEELEKNKKELEKSIQEVYKVDLPAMIVNGIE